MTTTIHELPYEENWLLNEHVELQAINFQKDGYDYYLHHWEQRDYDADTLIYRFPDNQNPISFWVNWDDDGIHWYTAYFYGGPFAEDVALITPLPSQTLMIPGDTIEVFWSAPQGFNNSCSVTVDLSTNGGGTWTTQIGPVPYDHNEIFGRDGGNFRWVVPFSGGSNCKLRLSAFDAAGNSAADTSHSFVIDCEEPVVSYTIDTLSSCGYNLCLKFYNNSTPNDVLTTIHWGDGNSDQLSTIDWVVKNFSNYGVYELHVVASNVCGTDSVVVPNAFVIPCPGTDSDGDGFADVCDNCPSVYNPLQIDSEPYNPYWHRGDNIGDSCDNCPMIHNANQSDTDSDSVGDLCDICPNDYDPYQADQNTNGVGDACEYCCSNLRGNADNSPDDFCDISDLTYVIAFLFSGGPAPICAFEADINGSGGSVPIDITDITYLQDFMFGGGPAPASCP
ncbi:MAG: PKD domain-containing protein [bacterium]|nr:PKD domain-containing protein [bacterium]